MGTLYITIIGYNEEPVFIYSFIPESHGQIELVKLRHLVSIKVIHTPVHNLI